MLNVDVCPDRRAKGLVKLFLKEGEEAKDQWTWQVPQLVLFSRYEYSYMTYNPAY